MAMIRYRSHDISSLSWAPCACGRTHPKIGRITGRSDDALSIGGLVVFPSQIEEVLVRFDEFGSNFCMVVENVSNLDRLTLQVEIRGFDETERRRQGAAREDACLRSEGHGRRDAQDGAARAALAAARHRGAGQDGLSQGGRPADLLTQRRGR